MRRHWVPSNGSEGEVFRFEWCGTCARDHFNEETGMGGCSILGRSLHGDKVWWLDTDTGESGCDSYRAKGERVRPFKPQADKRQESMTL